jgi:signal transduction histidine kinase
MQQLQQFVEVATGSLLNNHFKKARLKSTIFIMLIVGVLFVVGGNLFIEIIERGAIRNQRNFIDQVRRSGIMNPNTRYANENQGNIRQEINSQITSTLLLYYMIILIIVWFGAYFLLIPLSKLNDEKEEFVRNASHELRTPLSILNSELQLSLSETDVNKLHEINANAKSEIQRLYELSNKLLNKKKLKTYKYNQDSSLTNTKEKLLNCWTKLCIVKPNKLKLKIDNIYNFDLDTTKIDENDFTQIIQNILENIIKHAKVKSEVKVKISNKSITFENLYDLNRQADNGRGLKILDEICNKNQLTLNTEDNTNDRRFLLTIYKV